MSLLQNNLNELFSIPLLIASGIYIRILLEIFGQSWVRTKAHTGTLLLLPIIVFVITKVISGNIALSLGMVGALSIVRFRNPVRSPLELASYFGAITIGIAAAVSSLWVVFLLGSITIAIIVILILNFSFNKIFNRPFFISSFSEGNSLSTITVNSLKDLDILDNDEDLILKNKSNNTTVYTLASNNFLKLSKLEKELSNKKGILSCELRR